MQETQVNPTSAVIKGVVISLLLIVASLLIFFISGNNQTSFQYVIYGIFIVGLVWSIAGYAKQIDYNATFGKYFMHGFAISAIITCIMLIFMAVFVTVDPSLKQQTLEKTSEQMRKNQNVSDEQIEQALNITRKFFMVMALGGTLLGYMFFGTIISLVTAAVVKKNPRPLFEHEDFGSIKPIE